MKSRKNGHYSVKYYLLPITYYLLPITYYLLPREALYSPQSSS